MNAKAELLAALRAERDAANAAYEWECMIQDPAGAILLTGDYSWDSKPNGGVIISNRDIAVEFDAPKKVTWKTGAPPPRPPGPSEFDSAKSKLLYALEKELNSNDREKIDVHSHKTMSN